MVPHRTSDADCYSISPACYINEHPQACSITMCRTLAFGLCASTASLLNRTYRQRMETHENHRHCQLRYLRTPPFPFTLTVHLLLACQQSQQSWVLHSNTSAYVCSTKGANQILTVLTTPLLPTLLVYQSRHERHTAIQPEILITIWLGPRGVVVWLALPSTCVTAFTSSMAIQPLKNILLQWTTNATAICQSLTQDAQTPHQHHINTPMPTPNDLHTAAAVRATI